jgi:hypothetical protein
MNAKQYFIADEASCSEDSGDEEESGDEEAPTLDDFIVRDSQVYSALIFN